MAGHASFIGSALGACRPLATAHGSLLAAFFLALAMTQINTLRNLPFGMPHWGMSFPMAAFTILSLRLAFEANCKWLVLPSYALLATTTMLVLWLSFATLKGLQSGDLLTPEAG